MLCSIYLGRWTSEMGMMSPQIFQRSNHKGGKQGDDLHKGDCHASLVST